MQWDFITEATATGGDGGSPILSYSLEIAEGAGSFVVVCGGSPLTNPYTLNSIVYTTAISSGATYKMRYRTYNVHGWSDYSPEGTIVASTVPDPPDEPSLTMSGSDVLISWTPPADTGGTGIVITDYLIEILLPDGSTY